MRRTPSERNYAVRGRQSGLYHGGERHISVPQLIIGTTQSRTDTSLAISTRTYHLLLTVSIFALTLENFVPGVGVSPRLPIFVLPDGLLHFHCTYCPPRTKIFASGMQRSRGLLGLTATPIGKLLGVCKMPRVSQVIIFFVLLLALGLGGSPCAAQAPNPECSIPGVPPVIELQCCLIIWFGDALAGDPNAFNDTWVPCVEGLPPAQMPAPPNPNPPPPSACIQPEIATATARAISPMDQGSCGITFVDPAPDLQAAIKSRPIRTCWRPKASTYPPWQPMAPPA